MYKSTSFIDKQNIDYYVETITIWPYFFTFKGFVVIQVGEIIDTCTSQTTGDAMEHRSAPKEKLCCCFSYHFRVGAFWLKETSLQVCKEKLWNLRSNLRSPLMKHP